MQEEDSQQEHQDWSDNPILHERQPQHFPIAKHVAEFFVLHLGQRRVHHQDQPDGNGDVGRPHLEPIDKSLDAGNQVSGPHTDSHRQKDPKGQKAVEKREPFSNVFAHRRIVPTDGDV